MHSTSLYRPQIDGLRAISILAVVGYHAALPGLSGGFVGVDVFFVISGYLILGQIGSGLVAGRFSLSAFYGRRFLRILPGLVLMLTATALAAWLVLVTPDDIREFRRELVSSALMYANHHFLVSEGDYFGRAIQVKPLLHTWSLMVEEQFYLAAPIVALGLHLAARRSGRLRRISLLRLGLALIVVSLIASAGFSDPEHNIAFFLTPFRAWEFAVGGLVYQAAPQLAKLSQRARSLLAPLGLTLIFLAVTRFDTATPYPSLNIVLPVSGAALVIAGGPLAEMGRTARVLSSRVLTGVGLLSYEWYLWHWPLLVFGRLVLPESNPLARDLAAVATGLGLAFLTYRYVDQSIRRHRAVLLRRPLLVVASAAGVLIAFAVVGQRDFKQVQEFATLERAHWIKQQGAATAREFERRSSDAPIEPVVPSGQSVIVIGDSHAGSIAPALADVATETHLNLLQSTSIGCMALMNVDVFLDGAPVPRCRGFWEETLEKLKQAQPPVRSVIIVQNWPMYLGGTDNLGRRRTMEIGPRNDGRAEDQLAFLKQQLSVSLDALEAAQVERILLVGALPQFDRDPVNCMMRAHKFSGDLGRCRQAASDGEPRLSEIKDALDAVVRGHAGRRRIDPRSSLCTGDYCSAIDEDGRLLYVDTNHVSSAGAARLYRDLRPDIDWGLGFP